MYTLWYSMVLLLHHGYTCYTLGTPLGGETPLCAEVPHSLRRAVNSAQSGPCSPLGWWSTLRRVVPVPLRVEVHNEARSVLILWEI